MTDEELDNVDINNAIYVITEKRKLFQSLVGNLYRPIVAREINQLEVRFYDSCLRDEIRKVQKAYPCMLAGY